jgi:DNA-binding FadR family transcriptional regulator
VAEPPVNTIPPPRASLAATVAERIVGDVARLGWPEGRMLGSEPELLARYGVSRAVLREAVRLVEHRQVARMRRGAHGGLVVTATSVEPAAEAAAVRLLYVGAGADEVAAARSVLAREDGVPVPLRDLLVDVLGRVEDLLRTAGVDPGGPGRPPKRAEATARRVLRDVVAAGWPVGELLGSEPDLMARYGVSRPVLREAVRLLEHHRIARMRRGPGGGLFVVEPGLDAAAGALALVAGRRGVAPADVRAARRALAAHPDRVLGLLGEVLPAPAGRRPGGRS